MMTAARERYVVMHGNVDAEWTTLNSDPSFDDNYLATLYDGSLQCSG
jgi:hypothetical protein